MYSLLETFFSALHAYICVGDVRKPFEDSLGVIVQSVSHLYYKCIEYEKILHEHTDTAKILQKEVDSLRVSLREALGIDRKNEYLLRDIGY